MVLPPLAACRPSGRTEPPAGTLRVAVAGSVILDPAQAADLTRVLEVALVFEPLVSLDPRSLDPRPGLASRWNGNRAQTRFEFRLRPARFADGSPVTAADVKATFDHIAAKPTSSPVAPLLARVRGYADAHDSGLATGLAGVTTPDDRTVVVELTAPFADLPVLLGHPGLGIVPQNRLGSIAAEPIGSGPFRFEGRRGGRTILRRVVRPGQVPGVERIELVPGASVEAARRAVQRGDADVTPLPNDTRVHAPRGGHVVEARSLSVMAYGLNLRYVAFGDERFRRAVFRALNTERLVSRAYGDAADVATAIVPAGVPGAGTGACGELCTRDTAEATKLVDEVFPGGTVPVVALDFPDTPDQRRLAEEAQGELGEAGIPTTLSPHPLGEYASFLNSGSQQLFALPQPGAALVPSAGAFLSPRFVAGTTENVVGLSSNRVDAALRAAASEPDSTRRRADYRTAERDVLAQAVVLPVGQLRQGVAVGPRVRRIELSGLETIDVFTLRVTGGTARASR